MLCDSCFGAFSVVCCLIDPCFYDSMLFCFLIHNLIVCVILPFATHIASPFCDEDSDVNHVIDTVHNLKEEIFLEYQFVLVIVVWCPHVLFKMIIDMLQS